MLTLDWHQLRVIRSAANLKVVLVRVLGIRIVGWDGGAETIFGCLHFSRAGGNDLLFARPLR